MEIYMERVQDMLTEKTKQTKYLKVREHKVLGPYVEGLRSFATQDFNAIEALIGEGLKSRVTAATAMNDESSRSHAVFTAIIKTTTVLKDGQKVVRTSRFHIIDLAGSERVKDTGNTDGQRLKELCKIN